MSLFILINKCRACGKEVIVNEAGSRRNPNGIVAVNKRIYTVNENSCPYCRNKEKHNEQ